MCHYGAGPMVEQAKYDALGKAYDSLQTALQAAEDSIVELEAAEEVQAHNIHHYANMSLDLERKLALAVEGLTRIKNKAGKKYHWVGHQCVATVTCEAVTSTAKAFLSQLEADSTPPQPGE